MNLYLLFLALVSFVAAIMTFTDRGRGFFDDQLTSGPRIHLLRAFFVLDGAVLVALALFL